MWTGLTKWGAGSGRSKGRSEGVDLDLPDPPKLTADCSGLLLKPSVRNLSWVVRTWDEWDGQGQIPALSLLKLDACVPLKCLMLNPKT